MSVNIEYHRSLGPQQSLPSFTRYSSPLAFDCFGTSSVVQRLVTISSDFFECYSISTWSHTLFPDATYCLFRSTTEDDEHLSNNLRMAREKTELCLVKMSQKLLSPHHENLEEKLIFFFEERAMMCRGYKSRQRIIPPFNSWCMFCVLILHLQRTHRQPKA